MSRGAAHPGQVRIQAAESGEAAEHRLQAAGDLPVVHSGAVQRKDGCSTAMLNEMDGHTADHGFHPASVDSAGAAGPGLPLAGIAVPRSVEYGASGHFGASCPYRVRASGAKMARMRKLFTAGLAAALMMLGPVPLALPANAAAVAPASSAHILVKLYDDGAAAGTLRRHGLENGADVGSTGARLVSVPAGSQGRLIDALSRDPAVDYAEADQPVGATSSDQYFPRQYALQNNGQPFTNTAGDLTIPAGTPDADVDAVEAWNTTTGNGIKVAVLDSGVASDNPDIAPKVVARANFSGSATKAGDPVAEDYYGHGTHVAGNVAATVNNTVGVAGVCPGCTILAGKVLDDNGVGSSSALANGINWAVSNGAKVINMSLGVRASRTLETAVNNAWNKGVVLVAAAGNGGNQTKIYPGAYTHVIAVGATDNNDAKAPFSTYGASWVDIAAPGVNVYSTFPNHSFVLATQNKRSQGYDVGNGSSMSSAIVAAAAALAWSSHPGATNSDIRSDVETTADEVAGTGTYWAYGRVNADRAVR
nr:S8 family serine peptidase [Pseudarthrobacter defluvii]